MQIICGLNHYELNHYKSFACESCGVLFLRSLQCGAGERPGERASVGEGDSGSCGDRRPDPQERNGGNGATNEERLPAGPNTHSQRGGAEITTGESASVAGEEPSPGDRRRGGSACGERSDHQRPLRARRLQLRQ